MNRTLPLWAATVVACMWLIGCRPPADPPDPSLPRTVVEAQVQREAAATLVAANRAALAHVDRTGAGCTLTPHLAPFVVMREVSGTAPVVLDLDAAWRAAAGGKAYALAWCDRKPSTLAP